MRCLSLLNKGRQIAQSAELWSGHREACGSNSGTDDHSSCGGRISHKSTYVSLVCSGRQSLIDSTEYMYLPMIKSY